MHQNEYVPEGTTTLKMGVSSSHDTPASSSPPPNYQPPHQPTTTHNNTNNTNLRKCCYENDNYNLTQNMSKRVYHEKTANSGGGTSGGGGNLFLCCCVCPNNHKTTSVFASLGVCILVIGYTIIGAFIFMALEGGAIHHTPLAPSNLHPLITDLRSHTVDRLWSITENLNILYRENWTRLAAEEVLEFQEALVRALRRESHIIGSSKSLEHRWSFSSSFLYSLTLITTIGYGSVSPRTAWGKLVTIIYALIGIPLMLIYLSTTGDVLARAFRRLYGKLCGVNASKTSGTECACSSTVKVPITLCLILVLGYICCGAVLFHRLENWSMLEGSYFCFTSLGTIGFGDLVPGQHAEEISLCACSIYILAGMALVAMCVSLVQEEAANLLRLIGAPQAMKTPPVYKRPLPVFHHNSLPRKASFQRNTPARRSMGAEPLVEYFVPRSVSEFDLSMAGDMPLLNTRITQNIIQKKIPLKSREKMVTFEDELAARKNPLEDVFM